MGNQTAQINLSYCWFSVASKKRLPCGITWGYLIEKPEAGSARLLDGNGVFGRGGKIFESIFN